MVGTRTGGVKAAKINKERNGEDFFSRIGRIGGSHSRKGGFASNKVGKDGLTGRERARLAGAVGGKKSSRAGVRNGEGKEANKDIEAAEHILEQEVRNGRDS